jgi:hypothetical protein
MGSLISDASVVMGLDILVLLVSPVGFDAIDKSIAV